MRIVFMGTPDFAVPTLQALSRTHEVIAVYSRPDAASGRGRQNRPSPVKQAALDLGLRVLQPSTLRNDAAVEEFSSLCPDLCVVAAFGMILPRTILEAPRLGCVNVHASILPQWRGAAPIQRAILCGDEESGVSIMRMEEGLDTGPVCAITRIAIGDMDTPALTAELAALGSRTLIEVLPAIEDGSVEWSPQDDSLATYAAKITKQEVLLEPGLTAAEAFRRVRASSPSAPARLSMLGSGVTVLEAALDCSEAPATGMFVRDKSAVRLGFLDGGLRILRVKPEGKQAMDGKAWACGLRQASGRWEEAE